jgi:hypothetical protein
MGTPRVEAANDPILVGLLALCWMGLCAVTLAYLGRA